LQHIFTDEQINNIDQSHRSVYAGFQRRIEHCATYITLDSRTR